MKKVTNKLLASAPTRERLVGLINEYFYSKNFTVTEDNRVFNTKTDKFFDGYTVETKRNRWIFKLITDSEGAQTKWKI